ncbi:helix-turn-helix transcriptional regulator [Streptomyces sp. E11-3]|uniref:LuxR C-terminal-related transcriptional regulator n=1 Tax=Streptomyces sp. E11-3 TaxID=3110112 RepID=UPI00397FC8A2
MGSQAAEVYRVMFHHPEFRVEDLAEHLGWSLERVHAALDECVRLDLIRPTWDDPGWMRPVNPEVGLQALLAKQEADLLVRQQRIADSRVEVARLVDEYTTVRQRQRRLEVERLTGIEEIQARIEELTQGCESELLTFATGGGHSEASRKASKPLCDMLYERGVTMRSIYLDSVYNDPSTVEHLRWLSTHGDRVRTTASLPSRMLLFDRTYAVLPMDPDVSAAGALVLRGLGVIATLRELFDRVWEDATPVEDTRPQRRESDELSSQERAVLRLLAEGLTDEVVARKLGISVRTSRRITADLMHSLGARSRFQAGTRAVMLGWLTLGAL